jgi:DNA-binding transcriptional LysR family regulator
MAQGSIGWEDLGLIRAIAAEGSLSAAARRLEVDHSTAFRRLGALEVRLGVRLFERARDGYAPTPAGEIAIAGAERLIAEIGALELRLAGEDLRPSGTVRLTTTDTLVELLAPILAVFRAAHPEIAIELVVSNAFLTLTRRDADVAVRPARDAPDHLVGRRIGPIGSAVYGRPDLLAADPATQDWIGFDDSLAHLDTARWLAAAVPASRIALRCDTLVGMRDLARAGVGLALLPCLLGDGDPVLARREAPGLVSSASLWLLTHPDLRRVGRVRAVLDFLGERLAAQRDRLAGTAVRPSPRRRPREGEDPSRNEEDAPGSE